MVLRTNKIARIINGVCSKKGSHIVACPDQVERNIKESAGPFGKAHRCYSVEVVHTQFGSVLATALRDILEDLDFTIEVLIEHENGCHVATAVTIVRG